STSRAQRAASPKQSYEYRTPGSRSARCNASSIVLPVTKCSASTPIARPIATRATFSPNPPHPPPDRNGPTLPPTPPCAPLHKIKTPPPLFFFEPPPPLGGGGRGG